METEKKFYVYVDFRGDDGKPFYVGKGITKRIKNLERNPLHSKIKNKHGIIREVVFETYDEQESFEKEIQLIQELQTHVDHGNGGANLTLGGDGTSGYKFTEEQRKNMSSSGKKFWEDPEHRKKISEIRKNLWDNPEYKEKMSESRKKMWEDPEHREKMKEKMKNAYENLGTKEKMKKTWENPELRKTMSDSQKKNWDNPEHRERMEKLWDNPERKENMSKSCKKRWEDPEFRAMMKEKIKLGIQKKKLEKLQQEV